MKQKIAAILSRHKKKIVTDTGFTPSAVVVPLFYNEGEIHVLFTQRSQNVNFHKGQACFPGGTHQANDASLLDAALREIDEEIGLKAKAVEILGELDDKTTVSSGYVISPFVAFIPYPYPFKLDDKEVEQIFSVPLSALMNEANLKQNYYPTDDRTGPGYAYEYEGHIIWGATARILMQLIELLKSESRAFC